MEVCIIEVINKIHRLKKERDAIILAHNYTLPEVQDIADLTGDSLELSRKASQTQNKVIVFAGVKFMAETAKILNPDKTVLMPDPNSGCPMADMITADQLRELKRKNPGSIVVCYVNSSAEVKAECDICCTSANAETIIGNLPRDKKIIFIPDENLADYVSAKTGRTLVVWKGYCPTHMKITPEAVQEARQAHPGAEALVHPECANDVIAAADKALSTGQMIRYITQAPKGTYLIGTENGMIYPLSKIDPEKIIIPISKRMVCPNMKRNSLEKILHSLETMEFEIKLDVEIMNRARKSLVAGLL